MKKILVVLAVAALCASCAKPTKCKCSAELKLGDSSLSTKEKIVDRPEDYKCSEIKVQDLENEFGSINFTEIAKINCVNYYE